MFLERIEKYHFADSALPSHFEFSDFTGPPTINEQHYPELYLSPQISLSHVSFILIWTLQVEPSQSPQDIEAGFFEMATYFPKSFGKKSSN